MGSLQEQLDEIRALLTRARELFGPNPIPPPDLTGPPEPPDPPE